MTYEKMITIMTNHKREFLARIKELTTEYLENPDDKIHAEISLLSNEIGRMDSIIEWAELQIIRNGIKQNGR